MNTSHQRRQRDDEQGLPHMTPDVQQAAGAIIRSAPPNTPAMMHIYSLKAIAEQEVIPALPEGEIEFADTRYY